ncbi:MAG: hypothetical protein CMN76_04915 [Spirochaetaceae bacterium]|nr:hypothetical protein [Spirochaetaceae bacterium]
MSYLSTMGLFLITALAEILGCYLVYLVAREGHSILWLAPGALSLGLFAYLLTMHPTAAGRTYAAYGGVYVTSSIIWLWLIEGARPTVSDLVGSAVALIGMSIIMFGQR